MSKEKPAKTHCLRGHATTPDKVAWNGRSWSCRICKSLMARMWRRERRDRDPLQFLLDELRRNAKKRGAEFSLTKEDLLPIPTHCPVLGIELNYLAGNGGSPNSASIDRTDPQLGYVPGNVVIMSSRANTLKSDASGEELRKVLEYIEKISKPPVKRSNEQLELIDAAAIAI